MKKLLFLILIIFCFSFVGRAQFVVNPYIHQTAGAPSFLVASNTKNASTTDAINTTGATFLVAAVASYNIMGSPYTVSDNKGNTWTATNYYKAAGDQDTIRLFYALSPNVGSGHTFTVTGGLSNAVGLAAFNFTSSGIGSQSGTHQTSGATIQPGSVTPVNNDSLLITGISSYAATSSVNSDFNQIGNVAGGGATMQLSWAWKLQTTAAAENPTWTISDGSQRTATGIYVFES